MAIVEQQARDLAGELGELKAEVLTGRGIVGKPILARVQDLESSKALEHAGAAAVSALGANRKARRVELLTYVNVAAAAAGWAINHWHF